MYNKRHPGYGVPLTVLILSLKEGYYQSDELYQSAEESAQSAVIRHFFLGICRSFYRNCHRYRLLGCVAVFILRLKGVGVSPGLIDPRSIPRSAMRKQFNDFMFTVMNEEPLDASLLDFDDSKGW